MTERYFDKFQLISYANTVAVNITERAKVVQGAFSSPYNYYLYQTQNNERPDNIAARYYEDPYMAWILYLTNDVIDPYYDWYMDSTSFNDFVAKKYGSIQAATNKIAFWRNNWYQNIEPITTTTYQSLTASQKKYYDPVLPDNVYATTPISYVRKKIDWKMTTNSVVNYSVVSGGFINDEIVQVNFDPSHTGTGQVCFSNSSSVSIQHVQGYTSGVTITGSSFLYGTESGTNTVFTTSQVLTSQVDEAAYWSPVYYYDYELEKNEENKSIAILNSQYSTQIADQLKRALK